MNEDGSGPLIRKVLRRLIPFCIICYLLNFIDRTNVAIAQHSMQASMKDFTADVYAIGISIFFIPYCLFELPSNLIMHRVGARRWIARIMITWGLVSVCFVLTRGPWSFYVLRALLGLAEAGFFPGILLYLSYWIPHAYRARAAALFMLSQAIAQCLGALLGGTILYVADKYQFPGHPWQWVFVAEGVPTIVMGLVVLKYLTDYPKDAKWLSEVERAQLTEIMSKEEGRLSEHKASDFWHALKSPYSWFLSLLYGLAVWAYLPVNSFAPEILKQVLVNAGVIIPASTQPAGTHSAATTLSQAPTVEYVVSMYLGLLTAIPFGLAAVVMLFFARHSDRRDERKWHMAVACAMMAVGCVLAAYAPQLAKGNGIMVLTLIGLSLAAIGFFCNGAVFWAVPAQLLTGTAVATALAIINSIGNLTGSFVGPQVKVWGTLNPQDFMLVSAGCAALAAAGSLLLRLKPRQIAP